MFSGKSVDRCLSRGSGKISLCLSKSLAANMSREWEDMGEEFLGIKYLTVEVSFKKI